MFKTIVEKVIGTYSEREIKRIAGTVDKIESLEEEYKGLSDEELKAKTPYLKERLAQGETLDDILPEAFATVREAAWRVLGMRHFRVQLMGGIILHQGRIAEMKTGEGKTLVATLPSYLNALTGKGVHIVTVNDYLAKRDSEWMGKVHEFLGLTVGLIVNGLDKEERKTAYEADITYGTNNEFGFDYLRDNTVIYKNQMVQRGHFFAIVDEVDSILVDEARTPLIISGRGDKSSELYTQVDAFVRGLQRTKVIELNNKESQDDMEGDYLVDEKAKTATLTPAGTKKAERYFGVENLTDPENISLLHHINVAIRAYGIMQRDIDYVVKDGQVLIVDEFTGRIMNGRRYSEGLHQAIEAKEHVKIENENKTLATITFQNYFRLYEKLSGMTGTAQTEEAEFQQIYKLDVVAIPTNKPVARKDLSDLIYKNEAGKYQAVIQDIIRTHEKGQPVLVGTISIEKSELLSRELKRAGVKHEVLNAKHHEREAQIVAQAGKPGAVTIATNMAGRGTDIVLGGNAEFMARSELKRLGFSEGAIMEADGNGVTTDEEVLEARKTFQELTAKYKEELKPERDAVIKAGGLSIIGTERHESRRIDNQLRGRSGRQGDPGQSRFYLSLDDDLMRLFGSDKMKTMVEAMGLKDDEAIENGLLTKQIESAQRRVEGKNFDIRKNVLNYDDVLNVQRQKVYSQRQQVLDCADIHDNVKRMMRDVITEFVQMHTAQSNYPEEWDLKAIVEHFESLFLEPGKLTFTKQEIQELTKDTLINTLVEEAYEAYDKKEQESGPEVLREFERVILLQIVDKNWIEHIENMEQLKQGIFLRAFAQHDPLVEYKVEGSDMFDEMNDNIRREMVEMAFRVRIKQNIQREQVASPMENLQGAGGADKSSRTVVKAPKVGRNDPCPCGSGKKYKKCCGTDGSGE
ncbi:MAG: preprotein translocase subunit SecA [Ruminococcaceae bacterium]|nr:preprotein translocase subunit SecA [Oscillospiraceae bacterium]